MRYAIWLVVLAGLVSAAGSRYVTVGDKQVAPKTRFETTPLVEVRNLRCWDATLEETGARCTMVCGDLWNLSRREDISVTVEVDLWRHSGTGLEKMGTASATIERPGSKVPVSFKAIGPAVYEEALWKNGCKVIHALRVSVDWAKKP